jgi:hypothetical protein
MIYLLTGRTGSGKDEFADILVKRGLPETTLFEDDVADMTAKFCRVMPNNILDIVRKHPNTAFKLINIDADDMSRRINFVKKAENKIKAEMLFNTLDSAEYDVYNEFEEKIRQIGDKIADLPDNFVGIYNCINDNETALDEHAEEISRDNKLHNRIESIIQYLAKNNIIPVTESDDQRIKINETDSIAIDCYADILMTNDQAFARMLRIYLIAAESIGDVDLVNTAEQNESPNITSRHEMRNLRDGDTFYVNGEKHTAKGDSHLSGDASYDGYIVYDENDESWFEDDFLEDAADN